RRCQWLSSGTRAAPHVSRCLRRTLRSWCRRSRPFALRGAPGPAGWRADCSSASAAELGTRILRADLTEVLQVLVEVVELRESGGLENDRHVDARVKEHSQP